MRKVLLILPLVALALCLVLVLMMTGVLEFPDFLPSPTADPSASGTTTPATSSTAETEGKDYVRQNMVSISLPEMKETIVSEDGVILFRHTFQDGFHHNTNRAICNYFGGRYDFHSVFL